MNIFFYNDGWYKPCLESDFSGWADMIVNFVAENQLKDENKWRAAVYPFVNNGSGISEDSADAGWRGEFWGKNMRGACMIYKYNKDKELYDILKESIYEMLSAQEKNGRISTYSADKEFYGWDMWGRKYVMLGMIYFYEICSDNKLKKAIIASLKKQLDYIIERIGDKEGQVDIKDTSNMWGSINSSTILEPVMYIYKFTGEKRYLDFASYIVKSGGAVECNLIEMSLIDGLLPYQYPVVKAYEIMSFFEGLLEFYTATGDEKIKKSVIEFADKVLESEITVIGCAGCTHEYFDNAAVMQSSKDIYKGRMQETCVTVTWMDLCSRLLLLTGDVKYADAIERTVYNALFGAVNTELSNNNGGLIFDSYSPVQSGVRGDGIGGLKIVDSYSVRGCCDAIGSLGVGLFPVNAVAKTKNGFVFNFYINGKAKFTSDNNEEVVLNVSTNYPADGKVLISVEFSEETEYELKFRIPEFSINTKCCINGETFNSDTGYLDILRIWGKNDIIELEFDMNPRAVLPLKGNDFVCVQYGPLVLARDSRFNENIKERVSLDYDKKTLGIKMKRTNKKLFKNFAEFEIVDKKNNVISMADYASVGKTWNKKSEVAVWMPVKK